MAAHRGDFDAVVAMYHDQGQIATKLIGFDRGVTLLAGLSAPVTTPAHGTAFDIAGQGRALVGPIQEAFAIAARMASQAKAGCGTGFSLCFRHYRAIPSRRATRSSVFTRRSTWGSVCAAVQEIRSKLCEAAGRRTGLM